MKKDHSGASSPRGRRDSLVTTEKQQFGGMRFGSAFFGWMTATGIAVLLTSLLTAVGISIGVANNVNLPPGTRQRPSTSETIETIGITGGIILAVVLFLAYYCGGYVAGRMARFDGTKQGVAVWLWAVAVAVMMAILGIIAGSQFNILGSINAFPRIPVDEGILTTAGIIALALALLIPLAGAVLGGRAGMHFHRKVDEATVNHQAGLSS